MIGRILAKIFSGPRPDQNASTANERLQFIVNHSGSACPSYLPMMKADIIEVIAKYVEIPDDQLDRMLTVTIEQVSDRCSKLEMNLELPEQAAGD